MKKIEPHLARALEWVASLPLLGDRELAGLVGVDERDARHLREELGRRGWVEWVTPRSDGVHARPLALVRDEALPPLADWLGVDPGELRAAWPVGRNASLERICRLEVVQGVNRLLAMLAAQLRAANDGELDAARSTPLPRYRDGRWWPPGVEAHLEVRCGREVGTAVVAWDPAGAPDIHRRERVRRWFKAADEAADAWEQHLPPILVVGAGEREVAVWEEAIRRREERRGELPIEVLFTSAVDLSRDGPARLAWRSPESDRPVRLLRSLDWQPALPDPDYREERLPPIERGAPELIRHLMTGTAGRTKHVSTRDKVASLALTLDPLARSLLEWLARHPWLTAEQLAVLVNDPEQAVCRRLTTLVRTGVARSAQIPDGDDDLWFATRFGLRVLAAANQVPLARFEQCGAVSAPFVADDGRPTVVLPRALAHELGLRRVFVRLAEIARSRGGRLAVWRNEAESTHIFGDGSWRWWIRPDGSGVLDLDEARLPFILEYDRGTLSLPEIRGKLLSYARYYDAGAWWEYFEVQPVMLWICADYRAAQRVAREVSMFGGALPALVIQETELDTVIERQAVAGTPVPHRQHGTSPRRRRGTHTHRGSHAPA